MSAATAHASELQAPRREAAGFVAKLTALSLLAVISIFGATTPAVGTTTLTADPAPAPPEVVFPANTAVVETPFELEQNNPLVRVRIDGSEPLCMVLDTGAGVNMLAAELAAQLGLRSAGGQVHLQAAGDAVAAGIVENRSIASGWMGWKSPSASAALRAEAEQVASQRRHLTKQRADTAQRRDELVRELAAVRAAAARPDARTTSLPRLPRYSSERPRIPRRRGRNIPRAFTATWFSPSSFPTRTVRCSIARERNTSSASVIRLSSAVSRSRRRNWAG